MTYIQIPKDQLQTGEKVQVRVKECYDGFLILEEAVVDRPDDGSFREIPDPSGARDPLSGERLTISIFTPKPKLRSHYGNTRERR